MSNDFWMSFTAEMWYSLVQKTVQNIVYIWNFDFKLCFHSDFESRMRDDEQYKILIAYCKKHDASNGSRTAGSPCAAYVSLCVLMMLNVDCYVLYFNILFNSFISKQFQHLHGQWCKFIWSLFVCLTHGVSIATQWKQ